jgi:hypothetical protein
MLDETKKSNAFLYKKVDQQNKTILKLSIQHENQQWVCNVTGTYLKMFGIIDLKITKDGTTAKEIKNMVCSLQNLLQFMKEMTGYDSIDIVEMLNQLETTRIFPS